MVTKVKVDNSVGDVPHLSIIPAVVGASMRFSVTVSKPDGTPLRAPVLIDDPMDSQSIVFVVSRALVAECTFAYGYNNRPYLWMGNRWEDVDGWLQAVSSSMHGLIRTGEFSSKSSRCFYNSMLSAWVSSARPVLELKPFGRCKGVPVEDGVLVILEDGSIDVAPHDAANENLHFLPVKTAEVTDEYVELALGLRSESLLENFLKSSLDSDQRDVLQAWAGLHLVVHRVGNPERMVYMYGLGGNGKGVVVGLLKALVSESAVANLQLNDLSVPSNLELLIGKMAMIGSESGPPVTDHEMLKTIVSWESMTVNPKYRDPFALRPTCLVTQASNQTPHFNDDSDAMVRRVIALHMTHKPGFSTHIVSLVTKIPALEYPLLVAWALMGAAKVMEAGTLLVPESVQAHSARVVRPVRTVDRFLEVLEYGQFEIAEDELYKAYCLHSKAQGLAIQPKAEFFDDIMVRLDREGTLYLRRAKATGYEVQRYVNERQAHVALVPALLGTKQINLFMGFRIGEGHFGPAIGQPIPASRRDVPEF